MTRPVTVHFGLERMPSDDERFALVERLHTAGVPLLSVRFGWDDNVPVGFVDTVCGNKSTLSYVVNVVELGTRTSVRAFVTGADVGDPIETVCEQSATSTSGCTHNSLVDDQRACRAIEWVGDWLIAGNHRDEVVGDLIEYRGKLNDRGRRRATVNLLTILEFIDLAWRRPKIIRFFGLILYTLGGGGIGAGVVAFVRKKIGGESEE